MSTTYFATQAAALMHAEEETRKAGYDIIYADRLWTEHVNYGTSVKYDFPLTVTRKTCLLQVPQEQRFSVC